MVTTIDESIVEYVRLLSLTENECVRKGLSKCIQELQNGVPTQAPIKAQAPTPGPKPAANQPALPKPMATSAVSAVPDNLNYQTISTFSWDQTETEVKVLIPCEGVSKDMVTANFTAKGFEIKVAGLNGKNYRCAANPLHKAVLPAECSFMVPKSQKRVVVKLKKAKSSDYAERTWDNLTAKSSAIPTPKSSAGADADPSAGIMDLMKNLYEDGDDVMKQTIAKAWTQSRDGKVPDGEMPAMPDMPDMPDLPLDMPGMPSFPL